MKLKSIVKYNLSSLKNALVIYYAIFITVCVFLILTSRNSTAVYSSGLEVSSAIFIFVVGLNFFKESFYFMKSNNVTRQDFIYGTAISMIPVALFMSILDIIINRIYNIFINCPTVYDMVYTDLIYRRWPSTNWVQSNSIEILFNTFICQAMTYLVFFSLGFLITIIYYKSNSLMKILVSAMPVALVIVLNIIGISHPSIINKIMNFITTIFGWNTQNSHIAMLTCIVLYVILIGISRLLTRRAIIK